MSESVLLKIGKHRTEAINEAKAQLPAINLAYKVRVLPRMQTRPTLLPIHPAQALANPPRPPINLLQRILDRKGRIAVLGEIKRASPSKVSCCTFLLHEVAEGSFSASSVGHYK
jgi:indole-3-glycerol phosphate synthase